MLKYPRIFLRIYFSRLGKDISLPAYLVATTIGSICFFVMHLLAFLLVIGRFTFTGWTPPQLWVVFFTFETFTYFAFFLLWGGMHKTVIDITTGKFDLLLTKPISVRFLTFARGGSAHNLLSAALGVALLLLVILKNALPLSFLSSIAWIACMVLGLWAFHCLSLLFISLNFKFGKVQGSSGVAWQLQELWKYPPTSFDHPSFLSQALVLPLSLIASMPAAALLVRPLPIKFYLSYFLTLVFLSLTSTIVWRTSLRHYSSASS